MYYCVNGSCSIKFNNLILKSFVQKCKILSEGDKLVIAREVIKSEYTRFTHKVLGTFIEIKSISNIRLTSGTEGYDSSILSADVELYFYKVNIRDVVDFTIESLTPSLVQGSIGGYTVMVPSDHLSLSTPVFNATLNCFQSNDKKFKVSDVLRIRVTSISNPVRITNDTYKIIGSCRNTGAGKLVK
jgi:DNA-directed RNA polymerase subunit E'/Rpb7